MEKPKPLTLALPPEQKETHTLVRTYYEAQGDEPAALLEEWSQRRSDGKRDGPRRAFYRDGSLCCEELWKDGLLWETLADFTPEGTPTPDSKIKDGNGPLKTYNNDGLLEEEGELAAGKKHGAWRFFYPNGALRAEARFQEGRRAGLWKFYSRAKTLDASVDYDATLPYARRFDAEGNVTSEGPMLENPDGTWRQDGLWKFYTKDKPTRFTSQTPGDSTSYVDPLSLLEIADQYAAPERKVKEMLKACEEPPACSTEKSIQNLLTSMQRHLQQGGQLPLEWALLCCELSDYSYESGTLGTLALLKTYGAAALPEIERRSQTAKNGAAILYLLAIQQILGEAPLPGTYNDLWWRALYWAERTWTPPKVKALLRAALYHLPLSQRELLLWGPSGKEISFFVAPTCLSEAVLQEALSAFQGAFHSYREDYIRETLEGFQGRATGQIVDAIKGEPDNYYRRLALLKILIASKHPDTLPYVKEVLLGRTRTDKKMIREALPGYGDAAIPLLEDLIANTKGASQSEAVKVLGALPKTRASQEAAARLSSLRAVPAGLRGALGALALAPTQGKET